MVGKVTSEKARWEFVDREKPAMIARIIRAAEDRAQELFPTDPFPEMDVTFEAERIANRYLQTMFLRNLGLTPEKGFSQDNWHISDVDLARFIGCAASRQRGGTTPKHIVDFLPRDTKRAA